MASKKQVALMFDEGNKYAVQIFKKLKYYDVHATYFINGVWGEKYVEKMLELSKKILKERL